jgi:hypothetical protein
MTHLLRPARSRPWRRATSGALLHRRRARSQSAAAADRRDLSLLEEGPCDVKGRRLVAATSRCLRAVGGGINRTKASPTIPGYRGRIAARSASTARAVRQVSTSPRRRLTRVAE